ncbi:disintegrin and metalloproteinase domain-containing protein unc-71 isoform X2 [Octopus bimaculoides]|nr:disintegrin and metalloproteinase domain-containing protein unc-71 isoform X2 [Octopus bimaculoides]|eukprot:XP_014786167.1 PREDICTED: disintegrin and metalloproteinase domain-containing protein 15-like isoform X2 [Octopus bimaculoides]
MLGQIRLGPCLAFLWTYIYYMTVGGALGRGPAPYSFYGGPPQETSKYLYQFEFNRLLLDSIPKPYQIVYPQQLRHNNVVSINTRQHRVRHHGTYDHHKCVTIQLELFEKKYKIRLDLNKELLSKDIVVKQYMNKNQQIILRNVEHCYYHGKVKRDEWSSVAVSTCNGIRGVIQLRNETYVIHPLQGGDEELNHPHVVFQATHSEEERCGNTRSHWLPYNELHRGEFARRLKNLRTQQNSRGDINVEVKLALIFDSSVYKPLNLTRPDMLRYALGTTNILDAYYKEVSVRLSLVYMELWNSENQIEVSSNVRETLTNLLEFKRNNMPQVLNNTLVHLVTSQELDHKVSGMSIPDSLCTDRAVGVSRSDRPFEPQQAASVLAHMIGHNLGIKHDEDSGCSCKDQFGCLMSTTVLRSTALHSRLFSDCSRKDLDTGLSMGMASCMIHPQKSIFVETCGNNRVERGEECDCGTPEECALTDPCCDPSTCLLHTWASCNSGECCSNCTVLPRNYVCRASVTECDVPEYCTGETGVCPADNSLRDGEPCANNTGYCYKGKCPTKEKQCQAIWGQNATGGDYRCFDQFNPTGNFNGHCGRDSLTGRFAKCEPENVQCGLLHCAGGYQRPVHKPKKAFAQTTVVSDNMQFECKIMHGPTSLDLPNRGLVQDGAKCGEGRICLNKLCTSFSELKSVPCPGEDIGQPCSGNGVCTTFSTCFCDAGWGGELCDEVVNKTTFLQISATTVSQNSSFQSNLPTTPASAMSTVTGPLQAVIKAESAEFNTVWLIIILISVVGGLVFLMAITMFCYRRRSPQKLPTTGKMGFLANHSGKKSNLSGPSVGPKQSRIISFGSLPSYRAEKLFGKKKKKRTSSEEESDIGELPPPPIIIMSPESAKPPERGILKHSRRLDSRHPPTDYSTYVRTTGYTCGEDDADDVEGREVQEILGEDEESQVAAQHHHHHHHHHNSKEAVGSDPSSRLLDLASFRLNLPPPPSEPPDNSPLSPFSHWQVHDPYRYKTSSLNSRGSPRSKIIRIKNIDELMREIDRQTIDLSPSPETPHLPLISPVNSIISSENSSGSHCQNHDMSCLLNNLKLKDMSKGFTEQSIQVDSECDCSLLKDSVSNESELCDILPMSPTKINSILHYTHSVPVADGDFSSTCGTVNSRGFDKSSGYESERDGERSSIEDGPRSRSRSHSRSQSGSPPCYSSVIRTGPNQIRLVPANQNQKPMDDTSIGGISSCGGAGEEQLQKILDGLPRIEASTYERSPICTGCSIPGSLSPAGSGSIPSPRPLGKKCEDSCGPCIDRSLEEISQNFNSESPKLTPPNSKVKPKLNTSLSFRNRRPVSLGVMQRTLQATANYQQAMERSREAMVAADSGSARPYPSMEEKA